MTGEDTTDEGESGLSRREMLGATAILGGASVLGTGKAGAETNVNGGASAEMQTSNEPRLTLGDDYAIDDSPDGNGDFVIEHLPSGAELRYDSASNSWTLGSLTTEEADITNESFIRLTRSADTSSTSAGTFVNAYDGESKDIRGEASAGQIVPDESGEYLVYAGVQFFGGNTTSGDRLDVRIQNVTDSKPASGGGRRQRNSTGSSPAWIVPFSVSLTAGKTYEIQARNNDSSFIVNDSVSTEGSVIRSVVG